VDLNADLERLAAGPTSESTGSPPSAPSESSETGTAVMPRNDEGDEIVENIDHIAFKMKNLKLDPGEGRFYGKSRSVQATDKAVDGSLVTQYSGFQMIQAAFKHEQVRYHNNENYRKPTRSFRRPEFWEAPWVRSLGCDTKRSFVLTIRV
jgi:hypothetical protein